MPHDQRLTIRTSSSSSRVSSAFSSVQYANSSSTTCKATRGVVKPGSRSGNNLVSQLCCKLSAWTTVLLQQVSVRASKVVLVPYPKSLPCLRSSLEDTAKVPTCLFLQYATKLLDDVWTGGLPTRK